MDVPELSCSACSKTFVPSLEQLELISERKAAGAHIAMLKCPNCWMSFSVDLSTGIEPREETIYRCPVSRCTGIVANIENPENSSESVWGCSYCGSYWTNLIDLIGDIREAIRRHPYRERFYVETDAGYQPSTIDMDEKYYEMITQEPQDEASGFRRD